MAKRSYARQKRVAVKKFAFKKYVRRFLPLILTLGGIALLSMAATVLWWSKDLPNPQNLGDRNIAQSTKIFDRTGTHLLYEIGDIRRTTVPLENISEHITNATIAAEDDQFYEHHGLDFLGILRAGIVNLRGGSLQGGSTITQQLIKNSILTPERTLRRKVKEAVLALELEQRFTKDEILEIYLNEIPYGSRAYGVEAAANTFFESSAQDVTVAQAALISALPKAPSYYSPYGSHVEDLKRRQEHIINRMAELNMISSNQAEAAKQEKIEFKPHRETIAAPHFVFHVKEQLDAEYGERVVELGGLKVITTLDFRLQETAEEVLREKEASLNNLGATNAALVAIDPNNGDILSMSGSIDYFNEDIDGNVNVAVRHRSPGSSFKPFVYAAAFAKGYTPETILVDAETDFGKGYTPKNYDLSQRGPVTMREALANSMNIPAVKTLYLAGIRNATDLAQKMGMTSLNDPDRYGLSLVLGGGEVRLVDEVSAYGAFATSGKHFPHRAILRVDSNDATLFDASEEKNEPEGEEVLDEQIAKLVTDILSDNAARAKVFGARSPLQLGSRPVAAKTGTTQEYRDGWTLGFTPSLVTGVWVGNNDNTPMGSRAAGVATAAPVWNAFMRKALAGTPIEQFDKPAPLKNIPHGILRGEIKEEKFKWDKDANTYYTAECPIAVGDNITVKEIHSLLFHVQRDRPLASSPANAEADPQFERWEKGIRTWIDKQNEKNKDKPEEPRYTQSMPTPQCDASSSEDLPKVKIIEPNTTIITNSPVNITVEVDSEKPIKEVRFLLDGSNIATRTKDEEYKASFSFPDNFSGRKTILVLAINEDNLIGRAHRTFIVNPDDSKPSLTLHTPKNGSNISATSFPQTVKITASDENGIDYIDVLFQKEGSNSSTRISRTSTLSPTAPNRYEVSWDDSPGTGTFYVYVIAYDKTGNFTQTEKHTVTIE